MVRTPLSEPDLCPCSLIASLKILFAPSNLVLLAEFAPLWEAMLDDGGHEANVAEGAVRSTELRSFVNELIAAVGMVEHLAANPIPKSQVHSLANGLGARIGSVLHKYRLSSSNDAAHEGIAPTKLFQSCNSAGPQSLIYP